MTIKALKKIIKIEGEIELLSGLHIGAGSDEIHIGGIDSPVVKDLNNKLPYIPGSSLKGKIRSLIEMTSGRVLGGKPYSTSDGNDPVCRIFGNGTTDSKYDGGPTRAIFSDCMLNNSEELLKNDALTEDKAEVSIDRIKGTAGGGGPRHIERVCRGAKFDFNINYKVFDCGDEGKADEENIGVLLAGMKLLTEDALGGSGSRGYGRICFNNIKVDGKDTVLKEFDEKSVLEKIQK